MWRRTFETAVGFGSQTTIAQPAAAVARAAPAPAAQRRTGADPDAAASVIRMIATAAGRTVAFVPPARANAIPPATPQRPGRAPSTARRLSVPAVRKSAATGSRYAIRP